MAAPVRRAAFLEMPTMPSEHDESLFFQVDATETYRAAQEARGRLSDQCG